MSRLTSAPIVPSLGQQVRELRIRSGLTQPELASALGVGQQWISGIESNRAVPSVARIEELAQVLARVINGSCSTPARVGGVVELRARLIQAAVDARISRWYAGAAARATELRRQVALVA